MQLLAAVDAWNLGLGTQWFWLGLVGCVSCAAPAVGCVPRSKLERAHGAVLPACTRPLSAPFPLPMALSACPPAVATSQSAISTALTAAPTAAADDGAFSRNAPMD